MQKHFFDLQKQEYEKYKEQQKLYSDPGYIAWQDGKASPFSYTKYTAKKNTDTLWNKNEKSTWLDINDSPPQDIDNNLLAEERQSSTIISRKKVKLSKKLLWTQKYNTFISFLKETYPDDILTNINIIQRVIELQEDYNISGANKLVVDGIIGPKTYSAIINQDLDHS